jgi:hypothetical protein
MINLNLDQMNAGDKNKKIVELSIKNLLGRKSVNRTLKARAH